MQKLLAEFNGCCSGAKTATLLLVDFSKSKTLWQVFTYFRKKFTKRFVLAKYEEICDFSCGGQFLITVHSSFRTPVIN